MTSLNMDALALFQNSKQRIFDDDTDTPGSHRHSRTDTCMYVCRYQIRLYV